jgi:hypothetical protein
LADRELNETTIAFSRCLEGSEVADAFDRWIDVHKIDVCIARFYI